MTFWLSFFIGCLSTPHGTLGTNRERRTEGSSLSSFNSTRYIRNRKAIYKLGWANPNRPFNSTRYIRNLLSCTPLQLEQSTFNSTRYIRNSRFLSISVANYRLSTPHGTLGTGRKGSSSKLQKRSLSTPHGTLGTEIIRDKLPYIDRSFNSTRYIRNPKRPH